MELASKEHFCHVFGHVLNEFLLKHDTFGETGFRDVKAKAPEIIKVRKSFLTEIESEDGNG